MSTKVEIVKARILLLSIAVAALPTHSNWWTFGVVLIIATTLWQQLDGSERRP
jgi:hypothetical protein